MVTITRPGMFVWRSGRVLGFLLAARKLSLFPLPTAAQEVEFTPNLQVTLSYSDNVFLAPDGLESSEYIGQINPGFRLVDSQGVSRRRRSIGFNP